MPASPGFDPERRSGDPGGDGRKAVEVVRHHLEAVGLLDPLAMAADYAPDALLERPDRCWRGLAEIRAYFATVPARLAGGRVEFTGFDEHRLEVRWTLVGGPADGLRGRDRYEVQAGRIVRQQVVLDGNVDF
jgi:hypothetical protein